MDDNIDRGREIDFYTIICKECNSLCHIQKHNRCLSCLYKEVDKSLKSPTFWEYTKKHKWNLIKSFSLSFLLIIPASLFVRYKFGQEIFTAYLVGIIYCSIYFAIMNLI